MVTRNLPNDLEFAPAPEGTECVSCGSTEGPDRRARYETGGQNHLDDWERCAICNGFLCDSCAMSGNHRCECNCDASLEDWNIGNAHSTRCNVMRQARRRR